MIDISSLIEKQNNNPLVSDQIYFNIDPSQKYAEEVAGRFRLDHISIEQFTIPSVNI